MIMRQNWGTHPTSVTFVTSLTCAEREGAKWKVENSRPKNNNEAAMLTVHFSMICVSVMASV